MLAIKWLHERWEKGTRYYEVRLHQDLWGGWVLTQIWGQRGAALGRVRHVPCASYEEGITKLDEVRKKREQRGYVAVKAE
jgi:hypothetical protein